ncbi:DEKNAAC100547 [Brettanomyces naardenensis]|uniref:DEKNAAC100547 n=1 Tax=Brettanomyces naardenensis TaxID=13370 RepID=A0A448YF59_BRENA|nr:DEKNAAC100547 [Brettanomyces naardenensis]
MFARRYPVTLLRQVRKYASGSEDGKSLNDLMTKLSSITRTANSQASKESTRPSKYAKQSREATGNDDKQKQKFERKKQAKKVTLQRKRSRFSRNASGNGNNSNNNNSNRRYSGNRGFRGGENSGSAKKQGLNLEAQKSKAESNVKAIYAYLTKALGGEEGDRIPQKGVMDIFINLNVNKKGEEFLIEQQQKSQFIRRKVNSKGSSVGFSNEVVRQGLENSELLNGLIELQEADPNYLSSLTAPSKTVFEPRFPNVAELELTKNKIPFDTRNRLLRALEEIAARRGYKLKDIAKMQPILPAVTNLYPFCNPLIPGNSARPRSHLRTFDNVPEQEIRATVDATVKGKRPELKVDPNRKYKTEQMRLNAEVVVNSLNSNAQLKVDNIHAVMSKVLTGDGQLKELPQVQQVEQVQQQ